MLPIVQPLQRTVRRTGSSRKTCLSLKLKRECEVCNREAPRKDFGFIPGPEQVAGVSYPTVFATVSVRKMLTDGTTHYSEWKPME